MSEGLDAWVGEAGQRGASDLHLQPGQPRVLRVDGRLERVGGPVSGATLHGLARQLIPDAEWSAFIERRSFDTSTTIAGYRCRINVLESSGGVGLAVRLLSAFQPTLDKCNLHPDLRQLVSPRHGLVIVCGTTGSGKSTLMAALVNELGQGPARHIITLEEPIEYTLRSRSSLIRQREVGRHTPSFEQGLLDALREDPDVILVGEMRRPGTMQLTLDAAETGHLVLVSMHASSTQEALARLIASFPADAQPAVRAQLAECLVGVVAMRLLHRSDLGFRVPECQVLRASTPVRAVIRDGALHKIPQLIELGAGEGQLSWERYRRWLASRERFVRPRVEAQPSPQEPVSSLPRRAARPAQRDAGVLELDADHADLEDLISQLQSRGDE